MNAFSSNAAHWMRKFLLPERDPEPLWTLIGRALLLGAEFRARWHERAPVDQI